MNPVVPQSREEKGLTEQVSSGCRLTKHWAVSREPSASCLTSAWTTAVASPCSPSFYRAPPFWAACLPQPEQSFQTINQITLLPTPLPPHLPIRSRREAKPPASVLSAACRAGAWERTVFCSLTSSPLTLHLRCVLPSLFLLLKTLPFLGFLITEASALTTI